MSLLTLAQLKIEETKAAIYAKGLAVAQSLDLPVTSWHPGDPTRSLYHYLAEVLSTLETIVAKYVAAGFLDWAEDEWLALLAYQVYGVTAQAATYAGTDEVLTNAGGGVFEIEPGDLTFSNSATGKTYRNTTGGTLNALDTLTVSVEADEVGADSSADIGEIDTLVTTLLEVTCTNPARALGLDAESNASVRTRCREQLGLLSPNGPADAYNAVARSSTLTGTAEVTRSRTIDDSDTGDVSLYIAGPAGAVSSGARDLVEAAIATWATPLCITPTVSNCSNLTIAITYELWLYSSVGLTEAEIETAVEEALAAMFAERPIGGDIIGVATGRLYLSMISSTIRAVFPDDAFRCVVSLPTTDTDLTISQVPALGTVTPTIHLVTPP